MKDAIHAEGPAADFNEIKRRFNVFFCSVPEEQCGRAVQAVKKRCTLMIAQNGGHFEQLL